MSWIKKEVYTLRTPASVELRLEHWSSGIWSWEFIDGHEGRTLHYGSPASAGQLEASRGWSVEDAMRAAVDEYEAYSMQRAKEVIEPLREAIDEAVAQDEEDRRREMTT